MDSADASRYKDRYRKVELQNDGVTDRTKASRDQKNGVTGVLSRHRI